MDTDKFQGYWGWSNAALLIALSLTLSGCVVVVGGETPDGDARAEWIGDWDGVRMDAADRPRTYARPSSGDRGLRQRVTDALAADPLLADQRLTVTVRSGDVTLHGEVRDLAAFDRAVEIVTTTEGVQQVVSRLVIQVR